MSSLLTHFLHTITEMSSSPAIDMLLGIQCPQCQNLPNFSSDLFTAQGQQFIIYRPLLMINLSWMKRNMLSRGESTWAHSFLLYYDIRIWICHNCFYTFACRAFLWKVNFSYVIMFQDFGFSSKILCMMFDFIFKLNLTCSIGKWDRLLLCMQRDSWSSFFKGKRWYSYKIDETLVTMIVLLILCIF